MARDEPGVGFKLVGGSVCLDFVNTVSGRLADPTARGRDYADVVEREHLVNGADLARWGQAARVVSPGEASRLIAAAGPSLKRARALRDALYRVFRASLERWSPRAADLAVVNRELTRARALERLAPRTDGFGLAWSADGQAFERLLSTVVRSAAELLTSDHLARLSQCGGEDCRWLFLDTSRNRSRRWCDMAECGNRDKVRRFRSRH